MAPAEKEDPLFGSIRCIGRAIGHCFASEGGHDDQGRERRGCDRSLEDEDGLDPTSLQLACAACVTARSHRQSHEPSRNKSRKKLRQIVETQSKPSYYQNLIVNLHAFGLTEV